VRSSLQLPPPLVLSARDSRRGLIVVAACRTARSLGIRANISLSEAVGLGQRSQHELQVVEYDPQEDLDRLCQLAEEAQQFSPIVGLEPLDNKPWSGLTLSQPQGLMLDIRGLGSLFGSEENLALQIQQWLIGHGYQAIVGIADTVGAAWALSRYGWRVHSQIHPQEETQEPWFAPIIQPPQPPASSQSDSTTVAPQTLNSSYPSTANEPHKIHNQPSLRWYVEPLPVEALRLPHPAVQKMQRLGVINIGDLLQLPRHSLASRLGDEVPTRIAQILGEIAETFAVWRPLPEYYLEQRLEYPTDRQDSLSELLRRMITNLTRKLRQQGEGALRIHCCMRAVEAAPRLLQLGLFRPTAEAEHLHALLAGQLERHWEEPASIDQVTLQITLVEPLVWQQPELFDNDNHKHRQQLALFLDSLSSRLGRNQVLQPHIEGDPIPESTVSYRPWTGRRNTGEKQSTARKLAARWEQRSPEPTPQDPLRRPLQLLSKPQHLSVTALAPDGEPAQFGYEGKLHRIMRCWGPERIESGWWRGPSQRRDYYRVETDRQQWWWIFRQIDTGEWLLHGIFD